MLRPSDHRIEMPTATRGTRGWVSHHLTLPLDRIYARLDEQLEGAQAD